jgi:hypothetical protein
VRVYVAGDGSTPAETLDLVPRHPMDRCAKCDVCLSCFGSDECDADGGEHVWVVCSHDAAVFRERAGVRVGTPDTGDDLR